MNKLEAVRGKVIEVIKTGHVELLWLEDVLIAIEHRGQGNVYKVELLMGGDAVFIRERDEKAFRWDLRKNLDIQSEDTINFLYSILCE